MIAASPWIQIYALLNMLYEGNTDVQRNKMFLCDWWWRQNYSTLLFILFLLNVEFLKTMKLPDLQCVNIVCALVQNRVYYFAIIIFFSANCISFLIIACYIHTFWFVLSCLEACCLIYNVVLLSLLHSSALALFVIQ